MVEQTDKSHASDAELEEMIAVTDTGARSPKGPVGMTEFYLILDSELISA